MEPLTSYQRAQYSFRRYLMHYYSKGAGAKLPKAQRYYDIVNQTDPEVLFSHLKEETLIRKMVDDAISKTKPPDDAVFNRVRTVLEGNLHHEAELERNRLAIPDDWTDEDLFEYHDELKQIKERIGSVPENLPELRKIDHDPEGPQNTPENRARSAHYLGTKSQAGQLQYSSKNTNPRLRAAETVLLNMPDRERIKVIEMDPERPSFKAYQETQRINQELGLPPQERRTARPGRTGSALTSQANYEKHATPELVEATGIPTKKIGLSGYSAEAVKEAASMLIGKTAAGRRVRLAGVATLPGALTLPASAKAFDEAKQAREQDPSLRNRALEIATGMQVAGDTLDVGGTALTATVAGAPVGAPMAAIGGGISNVGAVAEQVITAPEAYQRSTETVSKRTGKTEEEVRADPLGYGALFNTIKDKLGQIGLSGFNPIQSAFD